MYIFNTRTAINAHDSGAVKLPEHSNKHMSVVCMLSYAVLLAANVGHEKSSTGHNNGRERRKVLQKGKGKGKGAKVPVTTPQSVYRRANWKYCKWKMLLKNDRVDNGVSTW